MVCHGYHIYTHTHTKQPAHEPGLKLCLFYLNVLLNSIESSLPQKLSHHKVCVGFVQKKGGGGHDPVFCFQLEKSNWVISTAQK